MMDDTDSVHPALVMLPTCPARLHSNRAGDER